jgi:MinD superfamily P-loop ATPase
MNVQKRTMRIAIASGKGGTGKTTIATNLAVTLARMGCQVTYMDGDVEAPNGHLFLKPEIQTNASVCLPIPVIDEERCTTCGKCVELCQYGALVSLGKLIMVFPDLCHGCGGCQRVCPEDAIQETPRRIGVVETGRSGPIHFIQGRLDIGHPLAPPVIRAARHQLPEEGVQLIDAPPGTACAAVQAVEETDYVLLVTEPTPFGLHDLQLSVDMLRALERPFGVVINRADEGSKLIRKYCTSEGIDILLELPNDRRVAEACSRGDLLADVLPEYNPCFAELFAQIESRLAA